MRKLYERLGACLEAGGSSLDRTVQINQWVASYHGDVEREPTENRNHEPTFFERWREIVEPNLRTRDVNILEDRPASTCMPVDRLMCSDTHIEVEIVGVTRKSRIEKRAYEHDVHVPLGGYSIGIETGPWLFTAGFIATDFRSGLRPRRAGLRAHLVPATRSPRRSTTSSDSSRSRSRPGQLAGRTP